MINDGKALTGLWFDRQRYFGAGMSEACEEKALPVFLRTQEWLDGYFAGEAPWELPPIRRAALRRSIITTDTTTQLKRENSNLFARVEKSV